MSDTPPPPPPAGQPPPPSGTPSSFAPPPAGLAPIPAPPGTLVHVQHVSKWFGDLVAVSDVSFSLGAGVTALLGPNGAGKSTMLRMLCGLANPSNGSVEILGMNPRVDTRAAAHIEQVRRHALGKIEHLERTLSHASLHLDHTR